MGIVFALLALAPNFARATPALGSDEIDARRMPWVHESLHHKNPNDFAAGTLVRATLGLHGGVELAPGSPAKNAEDDGSAVYESPVLRAQRPFHELCASFNADVPSGAGLWFEVRVARADDGGAATGGESWSDWLRLCEWGRGQPNWAPTTECAFGRVDVDTFRASTPCELVQYRLVAWPGDARDPAIHVARVDVTLSTRDGLAPEPREVPIPEAAWKLRLPVPFRSQKAVRPELAPRVCSPTSIAMVMEFHGVKRATEDVAKRVYDSEHDLYGNWTRAIQGAYTFGVAGYLTRVSAWRDVERSIAIGEPLVASIAAGPGDLAGAPYAETAGHLIVIAGFDADGNVLVADPAAESEAGGVRSYTRAELEKCWIARGGTAYVFLSKR
jgi:hypothetical protein